MFKAETFGQITLAHTVLIHPQDCMSNMYPHTIVWALIIYIYVFMDVVLTSSKNNEDTPLGKSNYEQQSSLDS